MALFWVISVFKLTDGALAKASELTEKYFSQNNKNKLTEKNFLGDSTRKFDLN